MRETLYWVSGRSRRGAVVSYRLTDRTLTLLAEGRSVQRGLDMDADYPYWSEVGGIMRLAKP